ncbi:MAG: carbohydrate kinase [Chromatiales bacterium 21-64-14]|nr:MAG: carbohydrate kinase [Chromatiales bacterium 21-64-14]HQU15335.1 FGGY-family carbohydrate kinase [Gammaproteobacteria bacterium]
MNLYVGIDLGTSGCRATAIDDAATIQGAWAVELPPGTRRPGIHEQVAQRWWDAVQRLLEALPPQLPRHAVRGIAVDGTAATVLLTDSNGTPLTPALVYDDTRSIPQALNIAAVAPPDSPALGATSGLAKLLWLREQPAAVRAHHVLHAADWIAGRLQGAYGTSDVNHCLKMGYDPVSDRWPDWLDHLGIPREWLPRVLTPGTVQGQLAPEVANAFRLPAGVRVVTGTTDSTAAFLATGARRPGEAVTSLGSTLVLKVIAARPVSAARYGIYSQPLGEQWLVGGASNSGGAVLRQFFTQAQLDAMTPRLVPERPTGLDYYPLPARGERFPIADPALEPRLAPRPADALIFFQGLLEGIAGIEARGYRLLAELGAPTPIAVYTVGGGAGNRPWRQIRARLLGVPLLEAACLDAAYGAALLARRGSGLGPK